jgi:hypothetical protein
MRRLIVVAVVLTAVVRGVMAYRERKLSSREAELGITPG